MDEKKVREAIKVLQREIATLEAQKDWDEYGQPLYNETLDEIIKYYETAIEALEKQLPKKVNVWTNGTEHCPVCDKDVTCTGVCVCPECYQLLDWSENRRVEE